MKKIFIFSVITYLFLGINTSTNSQNLNEDEKASDEILKVGLLVPLSGEFKEIGESILRSIKLATKQLNDEKIKIFPKDSKGNAEDSFKAAKDFENLGIKIVIGPVFYTSLSKLNKIDNITFISLTNKTQKIPKNIISFGINFESQLEAITKYLLDNKVAKTILLLPDSEFSKQINHIIKNNKYEFFKTHYYDTNPEKLTAAIEKITNYKQRKINLKSRVKILEKSELIKDKNELKKLELKHTLGEINFKSVLIADFDESLKSVINSFTFADVSSDRVKFFTFNQWFDESLFNETSFQDLIFPGINLKNFRKFNKKYYKTFGKRPVEISILAYDALALIYSTWNNNKTNFKTERFSSKIGFKGLQGEFIIKNNINKSKLNLYKILNKKFTKIN
jgi:hypothetical protein